MNTSSFQSFPQNRPPDNLLKKLFTTRTLTIAAVVVTLPFLVLSLMPNPALRKYDDASANTAGVAVETETMVASGDVLISNDSDASNGQFITFASASASIVPSSTPEPTVFLEATTSPVPSFTPEASASSQ
jgi:hypothetical protein